MECGPSTPVIKNCASGKCLPSIAMKGIVPHEELRELPDAVHCAQIVPLHVPGLDAERNLLLLKVKDA